jgi:vancomycin resistance protein YoaR
VFIPRPGIPTLLALIAGFLCCTASARQHRSRCWTQHDTPPTDGYQLAEFTTHFKAEDTWRANNVRRAAARLNGTEILPYETLSYNDTVGPRTEETGFEYAPVIYNGKLKYKPGGGVCQPSSTLHAAAILCGLRIVKRRSHSWQSAYIASGFDAAVAWKMKDLVIKNPYGFKVRIVAEIGESHLTMRLFGDGAPSGWFDLETMAISERAFDEVREVTEKLPPGETKVHRKGIQGLKLARTMVRTRPKKGTRRFTWSTDIYRPRTQVIRVGAETADNLEPTTTPAH